MPSTYILYSPSKDTFYIGSTNKPMQERLFEHIHHVFTNSFTQRSDDWELFLEIQCANIIQARAIEFHIKRMKSKRYIRNLVRFPEMIEKLKFQIPSND